MPYHIQSAEEVVHVDTVDQVMDVLGRLGAFMGPSTDRTYKRWAVAELETLRRCYPTTRDTRQLATRLGRSVHTVHVKAHSLGLKKLSGVRGVKREVGSYGVGTQGYLNVKVRDDGPAQGRFVNVHRLVWIAHNGPIPEGHVVAFKKGMRTVVVEQITVDRLECILPSQVPTRRPASEANMEAG